MLLRFLHLYRAIKSSIDISDNIKNKDQLLFSDNDLLFLKNCLDIFKIFVKASTILQADKYPTISYIYPYIYQIRTRLEEKFRETNLVSLLFIYLFIYLLIFLIEY